MSEEEAQVDDRTEVPPAKKPAKASKVKAPVSPAQAVGRIAGASVAIPTAAVVFISAALAGVPATTAAGRSVLSAAVMWLVAGLATRILFAVVARSWRDRMKSEPGTQDMAS